MTRSRFALVFLALLLVLACLGTGPGPLAAGAGLAWLVQALRGSTPARALAPPALASLALLSVYAANASHRWADGLGLVPQAHLRWLPASVHSPSTVEALLAGVCLWGAFALAATLRRSDAARLAWVAALLGAVMAALALWQRLEPKPFPVFEYTGLFVSENHFAAFANLVFPVALGLASACGIEALRTGRTSSPAGLAYLAAALLAAAIFASGSRAGVGVLLVSLLLWLAVQWRLRTVHPFLFLPLGRLRRAALVLLLAGLCIGGATGVIREWRSWDQIGSEVSFRGLILHDTFAMWRARPLWGVGPGAFEAAHPYYQSGELGPVSVRHAHCEPAQFLAEWGVGGLALLAAACLWSLRKLGRRREPDRNSQPWHLPMAAGFAIGLAALGLHSLVDFPFRALPISLLAAAAAGAFLRFSAAPRWSEEDANIGLVPPANGVPSQPTS